MIIGSGIFGLSKLLHSSSSLSPSQLASQTDQALSADLATDTLTLNLDTTLAKGKTLTILGQLSGATTNGLSTLQVAGDLQASGSLLASGGTTFLNNSGLVINKVTVCTATGCIPNAKINPVTGSTGTAAVAAGLTALPADTTLQGNTFNAASQLVQLTTAGLLPALSGANLTNLNASNLASGTLDVARLATASITYTKLSLAGSLLGSDIASNAAIADTKLATISTAGKVADSALSANVALLVGTGPQTFSGNNKFAGTFLAQNGANSTSAFAIQNAAGTSNLLTADTTNTRIAIAQTTAAYTLDVNGDINSSTGVRVGGALLCSASGCTASSGSGNYIQNSLNLQTANFNIQTVAASSVTGIIRATATQTADLLQLKNSLGTNVVTIGPTGNTLIQPSTNSINAFSVQNNLGTSLLISGDTLNARVAIATAIPPNYTLDVGGDINTSTGLRVAGNLVCSTTCTPGSGSGSYVQNGTAVQTANYAIQSAVGTSIGAYIRGASGQSADLLDVVGIGAGNTVLPVATFSASGNILFQNAVNSTTAFQLQNLAGNNLLAVDTTTAAPIISLGVTGSTALASTVNIATTTGNSTQIVNIGATNSANNAVLIQGGTGATAISLSAGASGNINVGTNAVTGKVLNIGSVGSTNNNTTLHIADSSAAVQAVTIGSTSSTSALTLQGGSNNISLLSSGNIVIGTSDTIATLLVLDTKTTAGDPTCTSGGLYYNSNSTTIRACLNSAWDDLIPAAGWTGAGETWTWATTDGPTFTFTVPSDVTTKYTPGMRIKLTQTTVKYFIITAVSTFSGGVTTITVYGGTDYTLSSGVPGISANFYSAVKAPFGFPLNPAKWTQIVTDINDRSGVPPTANTWTNLGGASEQISLPIGTWRLGYNVVIDFGITSGQSIGMNVTLSTANNTESDSQLTSFEELTGPTSGTNRRQSSKNREKAISVAANTTYYLNAKVDTAASVNAFEFRGDLVPTMIYAVCAYL